MIERPLLAYALFLIVLYGAQTAYYSTPDTKAPIKIMSESRRSVEDIISHPLARYTKQSEYSQALDPDFKSSIIPIHEVTK
jgi:hypothetical protein